MPTHAIDERSELAEALLAAGGDAPTLCGEWTARQLVAHLVLRERSLTEVLGRVPVARVQAIAQRHLDDYAARVPFEQLVASFAAGPPRYSPFAIPQVCEAVNLLEYLVHDEDVRRAGSEWQPREFPPDRLEAIWSRLRIARFTMRSVPVTVRLVWPGHRPIAVGRGTPRVTVSGDPVEIALLAFGRQQVARLDYEGSTADVAALKAAKISI